MRFNDAVLGLVLIVFAIAEIAYTTTFPQLPGQDYGSALFPRLIGAGLLLCGIILTVRGWRTRTAGWTDFADWVHDRISRTDVLLIPASLIFYILISDPLGFVPTAFILLLVLLLRYGNRLVLALPLAAVTTLVIHALFAKLLLVPLPWGVLEPVAW
ncbi:MAG: tripartite tricarboxylate transporter TctB family protein [Candidatus Competibacteraceae bacterium]|nr:tripartite tricarboxylate transporter TctB family protein [Candidatus Competibacteraceae bacterium]MCB1810509.1 tripartite tricarboxylate transporter TctB family protein [Candidatus Competibacteraceae bacterium]